MFELSIPGIYSFRTYKLTCGEYYERCGFKSRIHKTAKWQAKIQEEELTFSQNSRKTTDAQQFDAFLEDYISVYDKLWEAKLKKKRAQESFRVYHNWYRAPQMSFNPPFRTSASLFFFSWW